MAAEDDNEGGASTRRFAFISGNAPPDPAPDPDPTPNAEAQIKALASAMADNPDRYFSVVGLTQEEVDEAVRRSREIRAARDGAGARGADEIIDDAINSLRDFQAMPAPAGSLDRIARDRAGLIRMAGETDEMLRERARKSMSSGYAYSTQELRSSTVGRPPPSKVAMEIAGITPVPGQIYRIEQPSGMVTYFRADVNGDLVEVSDPASGGDTISYEVADGGRNASILEDVKTAIKLLEEKRSRPARSNFVSGFDFAAEFLASFEAESARKKPKREKRTDNSRCPVCGKKKGTGQDRCQTCSRTNRR